MFEDIVPVVINFLTQPTWHLVMLYVVLLLLVAWYLYKTWFPA
ncbi:MAG: hypothetical protein Q8Q48_03295 [Candidatus Staskawiczbacteria bacterium]|nr:hypothetical protein [Candidatus Staskawiczbacteria bacterium]